MSAQSTEYKRIQEIFDIILQTQRQITEIAMTRERFLNPISASDELIIEGIENRIFRVAEEGGRMNEEAELFGFERKAMSGLRNVLAHDYGQIDREIIWNVIEKDFPTLVKSCKRYCASLGVELQESKR